MNKKSKLAVLFALIVLITALACAGTKQTRHRDIVYMLNGSEHIGELKSITETEVTLDTRDGELVLIADSVRSIDLRIWRPGDDWENRLDVDDSLLSRALETADEAAMEYTNAGYVTLYEKAVLTVNADSSATYVQRYIYYIVNERGKNVANWSDSYFEDCQSIKVDFARAVGLSKVNTVADNAIEDGSSFAWLAEYQRERRKKFSITGASLGSVVDYQVTKHFDKLDDFTGLDIRWAFYNTEPILESVFEVRYDKDIPLKFHEVELSKPIESKNGDYFVRTYRMTDIEPYVEETMLPNLNWFMPNVVVTLPNDNSHLSAAYAAKVSEATDAMDELERRLAEKFPEGNPSLEDVYNYVSENYTSHWVGMSNYYPYPKPLSELLKMTRVADHELVFLLYAFLEAAGYEPELVMVGPGTDTKIPTDMFNIQFYNSLRVRVNDNGVTRYLRPNEYWRYDHQYLHAVYVLPVSENGEELEMLERLPGDYTYTVPNYECELHPDGTLDATYTESYHGPTGGDHYRWHKNDKQRELDNYFDGLAKEIDEMANLVDYELTGFKELSDEVHVTYSVEIPGYAVRAGEQILAFRLPTVEFNASNVGAAERKLPFSRAGNIFDQKTITIKLPKGYEIEYIPESVDLSVGYRSFKGEISVTDNVISYTETSTGEHAPLLLPDKYSEYKEMVEKQAKFGENWILIRKIRG